MQKSQMRLLTSLLACLLSIVIGSSAQAAQTVSIPLSGTAVINEVTNVGVTPPLLDMGAVEVGQTLEKTLTVTNLGGIDDVTIQINDIVLQGADSTEFDVDMPATTSLTPGQSADITVRFFPATTGKKNASLQIDHDGASAEHVIFFKGMGTPRPVSELVASPGNLGLGTINMGASSKKNLVVTNQGEGNAPDIVIEAAELSGENAGDFSTSLNSAVTLAPGESHTVAITMTSATFGDKAATLTLNNDGVTSKVKVALSGKVNQPGGNNGPKPEFGQSQLVGASLNRPTTLQFGPDGKLYVGQMNGMVSIFGVARNGQNDYVVTSTETISLVHDMVNHDDDGTVNPAIVTRLLTGLVVSGTANAPKIYLTSTDPRQGGGASGEDKNLDTNSGILSLLSKQGANWVKTDLVRGLSRSEENHQGNGLIFDQSGTKLLLAAGGNTNMGAPSHNFAMTTEYALSAAILEIDLTKLGPPPYDLPTLDDEDRPGVNDANDPFGGNNGKNQAMLIENGPVQIYSPGFRNPYDIVMTEAGRLYTVDNGPNAGWGAPPLGDCSNTVVEPGITHGDGLHYISQRGYFGGHPNPTRGSKANTFNASNPQTPIQGAANPTECQYLMPGTNGNELNVFSKSTNGLAEYTASNFSGAMQGDLLAASFDKAIWRITLNASGDTMLSKSKLLENSAITPLDVIAQGDLDPFPGTIWVADFNSNSINIFEPEDSVQSSANPSASFVADSQTVTHSQSIPDQSGALPGAEATLTIVPNYFENHPLYIDVSSSAEPGAMTLTNKSTSGQWIQTVVIDLSSAILPDILFDPDAVAGDSAGKTLTSDSDASLVGLGEHTYAQPQGEGYRQVKVDFEHFQPDESWQFSVDIDPSSIKGSPPPGPKDSGSINGLEMSGARITVYFSDGTIKSNDLFATTQTQTDSETHIRAQQPSRPSIQVLGVQTPGAVSKSGQTVRITGLPGYEARLLVAEGALHLDGLAGGGFELDPYEANTILSVVEHRATIGANGIVDIPITLRKTHADGGINHLSATLIDANDDTGLVSNTEILELN